MKNLDCNQINIFINFEIIEENKYKKILNLFFFLNLKNFCNLVKSLSGTTFSKPNFYYVVYVGGRREALMLGRD